MGSKKSGGLVLSIFFFLAAAIGAPAQARQHAYASRSGASIGDTWFMNLGPGFLIGGGVTAPGVGIGFATHITSAPVYLGLDTGSYFVTNPFAWVIPVMPMVKYEFFGHSAIVPTLGLSLGPVFGFGSGYNTVSFGMLFKPGIMFNVNRDFDIFVEPRLGVIGTAFTFDPEFCALFRL